MCAKKMDVRKIIGILLAGIICFSANTAYALECEIKYTAKRVQKAPNWFGSVEKPKFKSGTVSGTGKDKKRCTNNTLKKIKREVEKDGWKVTGYRLIRSSE